jgi:hypothetical protein
MKGDAIMSAHWEFYALSWLAFVGFVWLAILVIVAWVRDRKRWRAVQPYYGRPYDASEGKYRPNVDLRRVR